MGTHEPKYSQMCYHKSPDKAKLKSTIFKAYIEAQRIIYNAKRFPISTQTIYLLRYTTSTIIEVAYPKRHYHKQSQRTKQTSNSLTCHYSTKNKNLEHRHQIRTCIRILWIAISKPNIRKFDIILRKLTKTIF